jgi:hypothetical protein
MNIRKLPFQSRPSIRGSANTFPPETTYFGLTRIDSSIALHAYYPNGRAYPSGHILNLYNGIIQLIPGVMVPGLFLVDTRLGVRYRPSGGYYRQGAIQRARDAGLPPIEHLGVWSDVDMPASARPQYCLDLDETYSGPALHAPPTHYLNLVIRSRNGALVVTLMTIVNNGESEVFTGCMVEGHTLLQLDTAARNAPTVTHLGRYLTPVF